MTRAPFGLFCLFATLIAGCGYDADLELSTAFAETTEVNIFLLRGDEIIDGVKFSYAGEEMRLLNQDFLPSTIEASNCTGQDGIFVFKKNEVAEMELGFQITNGCNHAWIEKSGKRYYYPLSEDLVQVLQSRINMVGNIKSGTGQ